MPVNLAHKHTPGYIFTFPSETPPMTYDGLSAYLGNRSNHNPRKIGSTITVSYEAGRRIRVYLYDTLIARLSESAVQFVDDDPHRASTYWIERIVRDNGLGHRAGRIRRRKADGPGPVTPRGGQAGLLCIDYDRDKPVFGRAWKVTRTQGKQEVTAS